ncbi:DedA family protein [Microbacterium phosphatis]|uniref:DedA family protein n=1 Tax=Microbacterium phosphatis TaxID=3140248 RepID=UPI00314092EB
MRPLAQNDGTWLGSIVDGVVGLMDVIGPYGAGLAIALENVFPPIPSEVILPTAGLAAGRGAFALWEAILWTTVGSVVGALALYGLGALLGADRLRRAADRIPLVSGEDVNKTVAWFDKHGGRAVFFGRFVPGIRSLISIPAGIVRMPIGKFLLLTGSGSMLWNTLFVLLGWFLGERWHVIEPYLGVVENVVLAVIVIAVVWFVVVRVRAARASR